MHEPEFDKFADEYYAMHNASIGASGEGPEFFAEYKIKDLAAEYAKFNPQAPSDPCILDFGAGSGGSVPHMRTYFPQARLTCVDVSPRSLKLAQSRFPEAAEYVKFDGKALPFETASFDVVFAACVFHHIDHGQHETVLREWSRVLRPKGMALIYEHNPFNPLTRRVVSSCEFDANAHLITASAMRASMKSAGFPQAQIRYRVFFPRALRHLRPLEGRLTWLPLGAQYYVIAVASSNTHVHNHTHAR